MERQTHHHALAAALRELAEVLDMPKTLETDETPGHREFQGCRRWVLEEARKYRKGVERHGLIRAEAYEAVAKAMGDYWLGPEVAT